MLLLSLLFAMQAKNPILWTDVPDPSIVRVGEDYYMSSTTVHMSPGLPIMKSRDLVNWRLVSYAYETLGDEDALTLSNGKSAYGRGSWASSLRHHGGAFYASTFSLTTNKTYIYSTKTPERTPWRRVAAFSPAYHDHSLFFDDNGRVYLVYGGGDIRLRELKPDLSGPLPGGVDRVIVPNATAVAGGEPGLPAEGSQLFKIDGRYVLCNIAWPKGGTRTQIVHRADRIEGPYEGRIMLKDRGVAQGGLVDTPDGRWFAYLFQDHGAVGRIPWLVPVRWQDGWPVLGTDGDAPDALDLPTSHDLGNLIASDEFDGRSLPLAWQWNHDPDERHWSLSERPGYLRLATGRIDAEVVDARNTVTQRTFGPACSATTHLDARGLEDGDLAGLVALQNRYGLVGVKREGDARFVVAVDKPDGKPVEVARVPLAQDDVFLRASCDFRDRKDEATFAYSLDGKRWTPLGRPLKMRYDLEHFIGYRFGLFNLATMTPGGHADFDFYHVGAA